jgi:DNA polymerase I-like protein with 3'-5' exonuclease and polymerase domains
LKEDFIEKYKVANPNSPKQITEYLREKAESAELGSKNDILNVCYDEVTGKWTSNAEAMTTLADMGYEFAKDLLDYRHIQKFASIIDSVLEYKDSNGLIHPKVGLAKTNRINYSNPGLMQIPKQLLWNMIVPYTDGNVIYSVDIKNQEPNLLINMTNSEELKYALEAEEGLYETMYKQCFVPKAHANILVDALPENRVYSIQELKKIGTISPASYLASKPDNEDYYIKGKKIIAIETICAGTTKGVTVDLPGKVSVELEDGSIEQVNVNWETVTKTKAYDYVVDGTLEGVDINVTKVGRNEFKRSWLAISYGVSIIGVRNICKNIDGDAVYKYITNIKTIKEYRNSIDKLAKRGVNTIGTIFGTVIHADVDDLDDYKKLKRVLLNIPIQGSAADILSLLIKRFYDYREEHDLIDKMDLYYTRHDELIIEVNGEWLEKVGNEEVERILRDMLEHRIDDWVPFKIEVVQTQASDLDFSYDED